MSSNLSENFPDKPTNGHSELAHQIKLQLSPKQYEQLFFQRLALKGDLAKRLGR
jgi:hypothetical protein